jgi:uncharacterized LabA/DUF88 family protein
MNVNVYVDGFNLYYRALKNTPHKWLNLAALAQGLLNPGDTVQLVRLFTARVSPRAGDPDAPRRQQIYFDALQTLPNIVFHYGRFLPKTKRRPLVSNPHKFVEIHDTEEKGSDVNLAVHLLNDGWRNNYDAALVLSQDTDLIEPIRMVSKDLKKTVGLIWLDGGHPNRFMSAAASFTRHARRSHFSAAQFPNPVIKANGTPIIKPATW